VQFTAIFSKALLEKVGKQQNPHFSQILSFENSTTV
jgi:hypothetical protein